MTSFLTIDIKFPIPLSPESRLVGCPIQASRGCGQVHTFTGPPVTWDALARHLTRTLAGQDRHAA
jgi:hypothetical protein